MAEIRRDCITNVFLSQELSCDDSSQFPRKSDGV